MKKLEFYDTMLFLPEIGVMVVSDIHIGRETQSLTKNLGLTSILSINKRILNAKLEFEKIGEVKKLVINGDLYDEFGSVNFTQRSELKEFREFVKEHFAKVIYVSGNHDTYINKYLETMKINSKEFHIENEVLFTHGDKIISTDEKYDTIIIGHEHPSVSVTDGIRKEQFKCFLYGKYEDKNIVVIPSFIISHYGTDMTKIGKEKILSPYLKEELEELNVVIVDDKKETHYFGQLKDLHVKSNKL